MEYDKLVVALGEQLAYDDIPGLAQYGHNVCTLDGAMALKEALARYTGGPIVVGFAQSVQTGGPAFEVALELRRFLAARQRFDPITFVDPLPSMWAPAGPEAAAVLTDIFQNRHIARLGPVQIAEVTADHVRLADGRALPSALTILTPPFRGPDALQALAQSHPRGWVAANHEMRALADPDVYVAGSAVGFDGPKQGHTAMRQAEIVAHNLAQDIVGISNERREYAHEMECVLDLGDGQGLFVQRTLWEPSHRRVAVGRQWPWFKSALAYAYVKTPVFKKWAWSLPHHS
jgi:sulfide:quinone oxidoreductase